MAQPISFRWPEEFVQRIDRARGDVNRSLFVRRAVEAALEGRKSMMEPPSYADDYRPERRKTLREELDEDPGTPISKKVR